MLPAPAAAVVAAAAVAAAIVTSVALDVRLLGVTNDCRMLLRFCHAVVILLELRAAF